VRPSDFPLGSRQSRAAARALLAYKQSAYERREVIISYPADAPRATEWHLDRKEKTAGRVVSIPDGMTLVEGLRMLGGYTDSELGEATELEPEPLGPGTFLMLQRGPTRTFGQS
jgi:hypothetical protein